MTDENNKGFYRPQKDDDDNLGSFYMGRMRPPPAQEKRVLPRGALSVLAIVAFIAIIWYAYPQGQEKHEGLDVPVIAADTAAYKFKPENPGGMEVRHQDSTVFEPLERKSGNETAKIMPGSEEPVDKDALLKSDAVPAQMNLDPQTPETVESIVPEKEVPAKTLTEKVADAAEKKSTGDATPSKKDAPAEEVKAEPKKEPEKVATGVYLQLGAYRDVAGAKADWAKLQKKFPQYFSKVSMRTERADLGAKGIFYRLQAGRLPAEKAGDICQALKKSNPGGCIVVK